MNEPRSRLAECALGWVAPPPRRRPALRVELPIEGELTVSFEADAPWDERRLLAFLAGVPELEQRVAEAITETLELEGLR